MLSAKGIALTVISALLSGPAAQARSGIYSCTDANGRRLTADRPIADCIGREQRLLNADGSVRRIVPPTLTADELSEAEAAERQAEIERAVLKDAFRVDRNLLARYPNEVKHRRAREAALDDVRRAIRLSESRLKVLDVALKPLLDEAEFYVGRRLPGNLKRALEGNAAATEAQRELVYNRQAEVGRINALFDVELERLKRLWGGRRPGSMGLLTTEIAAAASAPASAPTKP